MSIAQTELPSKVTKRSMALNGHRTSISLEDEFFGDLKTIAFCEHKSLGELVAHIDQHRRGNLSSAIRVFVLNYIKQRPPTNI